MIFCGIWHHGTDAVDKAELLLNPEYSLIKAEEFIMKPDYVVASSLKVAY